jgi:hypothetical protein
MASSNCWFWFIRKAVMFYAIAEVGADFSILVRALEEGWYNKEHTMHFCTVPASLAHFVTA